MALQSYWKVNLHPVWNLFQGCMSVSVIYLSTNSEWFLHSMMLPLPYVTMRMAWSVMCTLNWTAGFILIINWTLCTYQVMCKHLITMIFQIFYIYIYFYFITISSTQDAQVTCFIESCPTAECKQPIKLKGACCPVCLQEEDDNKRQKADTHHK